MPVSYFVFVPLILCLVLNALPSRLLAQQRAPVPDAPAGEAAKKAAGEIYGARFQQAKTTAEKTALAAEMIEAAGKLQDGAADQYVLLNIAVDIAAGAGDAPTALQAIEALLERFDVPDAKLTAETLLTASRNATMTSQHTAVGEAALRIADAVADADEYELTLRLCESARSSAQKTRQFALAKDLTEKSEEIEKRQIAFQEYQSARAVLDKNPTDPAANLAAGRYLCFMKGDWDRGVPMLALGSDANLKAAATQDLRGANSAEEQAAIGDAWWDAAETKQGDERDVLQLRAGFWYRQAEPAVRGGLTGLKIKQRLEQMAKLGLTSRLDEMAASGKTGPSPVANRGLGALAETASLPGDVADAPLFRVQTFSWTERDPPTRLIPVKDGLCFLSMVTGDLLGGGEAVAVTAAPDGWWYLNGKSQQWLRAEATAVESDRIKLSPSRAVPWKPKSGVIRLIDSRDGFCYLSAISGGLRGPGEAVHVTLEEDGWWYLSGKSGVAFNAMAAIVPWPSRRIRAEVTSYAWRGGDPPVKMIHKNEGFCLLSGIGGAFHGGGERVEISLGVDDFWYLRGSSARAGTFGEAIALRFAKPAE